MLVAYGFIPTLQPTDNFGRIFAVYGKFGHAGTRILLPHHTSRHFIHYSLPAESLAYGHVSFIAHERWFANLQWWPGWGKGTSDSDLLKSCIGNVNAEPCAGGFFIVLSYLWGWALDGIRPDTGDWIGTGVALVGVCIAMFWRR